MWMVLVFVTLAYVDATEKVAQCPQDCNCQLTYSDRHLIVHCGDVSPDVDKEQLSHQLDSYLSVDHFVEHLSSLSITNTPLTRVPASVCKLLNLTSLNLNHNKLTELPDNCFTKLTKLVTLSATGNAITRLQDGLFDGLQSLVNLYLHWNRIAFIGIRVFSNSSDLIRLYYINLDNNRVTSLEPWCYYRLILGNETSLVTVSLSHNLISNFTNELQFAFRCGMKRPHGHLDLSYNRILHIMDILNGWDLDFTTIVCLRNYKKGGYPLLTIDIGGNAYICDCTDFPFYKLVKTVPRYGFLNDVRCDNLNNNGVRVRANTVPLDEFVCEQPDRCPSSCRCVYRPANATLHVYCTAANLSSLPLDLPPLPKSYVKYKLDFSNNQLLRSLEHRPYFVNTSILDVGNCSLTEINRKVLKDVSRFTLVNFRENVLHSFSRQSDTVNISARLLIGNNPWRCSCDDSWMIGWLQSLSHQISDPGDIVCSSPSRMYGRNVLKSTVEDFCVDPVKRALTITLSSIASVAVVLIFLVITGLLFYKWRIRVYRKWNYHPFDRDECVGEDMDYDVFLCCSSEDDNPHGRRILEIIEANGYRVCYHERDFVPGQMILNNIAHSIERSKRTMCLLSDNFVNRYTNVNPSAF